ncbi:PLP-dependent aminotransferase family protein [Qingshengfaniella alkalisoli]|uniref:MocR-like ectoine utilization transcription factor EhuR n=1 Tax=Qingshengfaniella alkalisoli TaxID=2599296 RepID=UPI001F0DA0AB|nr:PLP-dependent aminotransferase family protein [Qingshengfaniella alkalisoli]
MRRPAYRSLSQTLLAAIEAGELKPGDQLPTHRDLAFRLGLSVQTVSRAYEELIRLDVIEGGVGRGTFVRTAPGMRGPSSPYHRIDSSDPIIDCSMLTPVLSDLHIERFQDTLRDMADGLPPETLFSFRPRKALWSHAMRGVEWLRYCGIRTQASLVIPTNGNSAAMTVALMTAASQGDLIMTEELCHHTLAALIRYLGMRHATVPSDEGGIDLAALDRFCAGRAVKALYILPSGLGPTGRVMPAERRRELGELARKHGFLIIENDACGPIDARRPAPVASFAPERSFYHTGFSKCLLPGLRLGYLVVPEAFEAAASSRNLAVQWMATPLMAEIASRWVDSGTALELLRWQRSALARRNAIAAKRLEEFDIRARPRGLHVWLPLSEGWTEDSFVTRARLQGVAVAPGSSFSMTENPAEKGLRICLGAPDEKALDHGLSVVARLAKSGGEPSFLTI